MALIYSPRISRDGLVLYLDAGDKNSYPGTGTTWYDLSGNNNHFSILSTAYNSGGPRYMDFNGSYGCAKKASSDYSLLGDVTVICWTRVLISTGTWRTLLRGLSSGADHQVIIQSGGYAIGMYDNVNGTGFNSSGYAQTSLPGYDTGRWNMLVWRWVNNSSPYYTISINDTPSVAQGTISSVNARFKHGFCSIGAYNNGNQSDCSNASQYWGDISSISFYNRVCSNNELLAIYNNTKSRYGL
jgi:hypothetical protein